MSVVSPRRVIDTKVTLLCGGTKHKQSFGRRNALLSICLAGTVFLTTACANSANEGVESSSASSTASAPASPNADGASSGALEDRSVNGLPTEKEPVADGKGTYLKTTISPDDPAFSYDAGVVSVDKPPMYTPEEVRQAHRTAVEYAVDAIDSPMNGTPGDQASAEAWWADNQARFDPYYSHEFHADLFSLDPNKPVVYKGTHRNGYGLQYGPDKTHISARTIETTEIFGGDLNGRNALAVSLTVNFSSAASIDGKEVPENTVGQLRYTMVKDPGTGEFLITGYHGIFTIQPLL